jgi:predicted O-methyltransferase YrrM
MTTTRTITSVLEKMGNSTARKDSYPTTLSGMAFTTPRVARRARRALASLGAAGLVLVLVGYTAAGGALLGSVIVCLTLFEAALLRDLIREGQLQQSALTQVRPLFGEIPAELGGWAADAVLVQYAVRLVADVRPRLVLECGSGSSTIAIARCLKTLGGRLISLEHNPEFARKTTETLRLLELNDVARVVTAPLTTRQVGSAVLSWYGPEYERFLESPIDVLIIDGPPKASGPRARYPAVPALKSRLAPDCWILMDDGDRPDERAIAHAWGEDLGAQLTYLEGGRGGWLLHRTAVRVASAAVPD